MNWTLPVIRQSLKVYVKRALRALRMQLLRGVMWFHRRRARNRPDAQGTYRIFDNYVAPTGRSAKRVVTSQQKRKELASFPFAE
jgi:hypothetical protein